MKEYQELDSIARCSKKEKAERLLKEKVGKTFSNAVFFDHTEMVALLLDKRGNDITKKDVREAFIKASSKGNKEMAALLSDKGPNDITKENIANPCPAKVNCSQQKAGEPIFKDFLCLLVVVAILFFIFRRKPTKVIAADLAQVDYFKPSSLATIGKSIGSLAKT